jgi:hypothetical protein
MTPSKYLKLLVMTAVVSTILQHPSHAASFTGKIDMLEVWSSGNIAFTLQTSPGYCNNQFIVNKAVPGAKNFSAVLFAAKTLGRQIRIYSYVDTAGCVAAESYGGNYISPSYIYLLDQ